MDKASMDTGSINDDRPLLLDNEGGEDTAEGDAIQRPDEPTPRIVYVLTLLSAVGGMLFGYDTGVISGAMLPINDEFHLSSQQQEAVVSVAIAGAIVGSLGANRLTSHHGRRPTIILASLIFTVGAALMAGATHWIVLLMGRLVVGMGIGLASAVVPLYIAEVAPASKRGQLVLQNIIWSLGSLIGVLFFYLLFLWQGWRWMLGLSAVPSIVQFVGFLFLPESPRWLISHDREGEAREILKRLRASTGLSKAEVERRVQKEIEGVKSSLSAVPVTVRPRRDDVEEPDEVETLPLRKSSTEHADMDTVPQKSGRMFHGVEWTVVRKALIIGCALQALQQLTGINTVMYYSATILKMSGFTSNSTAIWMAAVVAFSNFLFTTVGLYLVDRVGRRKLTLGSLAGVVASLFLMAMAFHLATSDAPALSHTDVPIPPADTYSQYCFNQSTCDSCVSSKHCGLCAIRTDSIERAKVYVCLSGNETTSFAAVAGGFYSHCKSSEVSLTGNQLSLAAGNATSASWDFDFCPNPKWWWLSLGSLILYIAFYAPGMGPMPWAINSEIYPYSVRSFGTSTATTTNWVTNLIISMTFLDLMNATGGTGAFSLYACICIAGWVFLWKYLPETKGVSLEDIERVLKEH